MIKKFHI